MGITAQQQRVGLLGFFLGELRFRVDGFRFRVSGLEAKEGANLAIVAKGLKP